MTEKLQFQFQEKGWVIDFIYKNRLVTEDFVYNLARKQMKSLNDAGLEIMERALRDEKIERAKPRPLMIDPWGNDAA